MGFTILNNKKSLTLKITGKTLTDLFNNAAFALFKTIETRDNPPPPTGKTQNINLETPDGLTSLLIDWLNEVIHLHNFNQENYFKIKIQDISENNIIAEIKGTKILKNDYLIKGINTKKIKVKKTDKEWQAIIPFEI